MKISFTTMATPELNIYSQISVAKEYGFDGLDFRVVRGGKGEISPEIGFTEAKEIRHSLKNMELPGLLCYNKKIQDGHDNMVSSILNCLHLAQLLEIPTIRIFTGKLENDSDKEYLIGVLQDVLEQDKSDVIIAMQNHIESGITLHQGLDVCREMKTDRVGIIVSPDHAVLAGENMEEILPELAPYTTQLYVADLDERHKLVPIGEGIIDFTQILNTLCANGFRGYTTLKWEKCWHNELCDYPMAFRSFLQWVNETGMFAKRIK